MSTYTKTCEARREQALVYYWRPFHHHRFHV
jgi:hypothetical protein